MSGGGEEEGKPFGFVGVGVGVGVFCEKVKKWQSRSKT
jgi:hypothetical protein